MSKEAAMRAMREARHSERSTAASAPPTKPAVRPAKVKATSAAAPDGPTDALCGHRSMNGRTCTREQGHEAKSHRYS